MIHSEPSSEQLVYFFAAGQAEGGCEIKHLVGGKGASLADMMKAGLDVPPGFTIAATCCDLFHRAGGKWPEGLEEKVRASLLQLEQVSGRTFGQGGDPLLVAVRSGAEKSMPGMMDTVLNVGLNPDCVRDMAERTGNRRGAWDAYRHFLAMFGHTVAGIEDVVYKGILDDLLREAGKHAEEDLDADQMESLCQRFLAAYRSRTGRDMPADPWDMLRQAIDAVFGSWNNERALAYRKHHDIHGLLGTAVNVQMMCPSEVSGVMFTANPVNPDLEQIIIESSYGLGEAIVLGKVTPDRFVLDKESLNILTQAISVKEHIIATLAHDGQGQTGARDAASLTDRQIIELARLGLRVESYFQGPCDIEWALSRGKFYLLQSRPIKGLERSRAVHAEALDEAQEKVRREEIATLKAKAEPGGTVWSRYNLAEILPEPTPMTWAIVRWFMSVDGGFGRMYRDLGFDPDPTLGEDGIFDLVCGRPYCNLSREPRMQYRRWPFAHSFAALKASSRKALYPQPALDLSRAGWRFWLTLPWLCVKMIASAVTLNATSRTFAKRLREEIIPAFVKETTEAAAQDLTPLSSQALFEQLNHWIRRTLGDFARDSLKPTVLASLAMGNLQRNLAKTLGDSAPEAVGELIMGVHPDPEADLPGAVRDLAEGRFDQETFLKRFGHRGRQEMELSRPRWAESSSSVVSCQLSVVSCQSSVVSRQSSVVSNKDSVQSTEHTDLRTQNSKLKTQNSAWDRIAREAFLLGPIKTALEAELHWAQDYLSLRETGKHYLMLGYAHIRRILVELDRRYRLDGSIFFLVPEELPRLIGGEDLSAVIVERRRRREIALSLSVPNVLFSDDLEAIGCPVEMSDSNSFQGVALSAGVAEGEALVLEEPTSSVPEQPYVLVCRSTDPAWVPLFVNAKALVMETGGVLSHGAIVAREFGLPAVAGLQDIHRRIRTGQRLRVDGGSGKVTILT